jgi:ABC-type oligopeptide transport system ATPase subunit
VPAGSTAIVELGETGQVLAGPRQPCTRQLLADTPSLETASSEAGAGEPQADN